MDAEQLFISVNVDYIRIVMWFIDQ
jgi:hypothetical protein